MKPLVSIVVPIYNVEKYMIKCVDSIINQTYLNLEIILVNDGSPDKSPDIADAYEKLDSRVKVIHKKNGGLSDARNVGLNASKGDYVCFIDSDDYVDLDTIEQTLNKSLVTGADVVIYGLYEESVDSNENVISKNPVGVNPQNLSTMISIIGYAWNKLYRTSFLKENRFVFQKGLSLVEDIVFNEKVLTSTSKIEYLDVPLYHYINRNRPTLVKQYYNDSYHLHKLGFRARENLVLKLFGQKKEIKDIIARAYLNGIRYCCSNMFYYKNNLTVKSKYKNIKTMIYDELTILQTKHYNPNGISDKLFHKIVYYRLPLALYMVYYVRAIFILSKKKLNESV